HKFCDVYLEIAKKEIKRHPNETIFTLAGIAGVILKDLHPFMPFITEEIWSSMREVLQNGQTTYLMRTSFPKSGSGFLADYENEHKNMESVLDTVKLIRSLKSDLDISTREIVDVKLISSDNSVFYKCRQYIEQLAFVRIVDDNLIGAHRIGSSVEIIIEATGKEKKKAALKIDKEAKKLRNRIVQLEKRLNNNGFLEHAEHSVVVDIKIEYKHDLEQIRQLEKKILEIDKL
ncbi:MAG: class I tRNA ligase family protein, partial [Epsilonproteobacteria bacterium]|nr:class I tRNA ligase family protein [Campylobacterota bacterium]